jgi:hypothetical protein
LSIIFFDGFDLYTTTLSQTSRGYSFVPNSYTTGRFGGQAMRQNNGSSGTLALPGGSYSALATGFAFRTGNQSIVWDVMGLRASGTDQCSLFVLTTGALQFVRGSTQGTNVLCTTAAATIAVNNWYYIEIEFVRNATTGSVNIYVNGGLAASATGVNTGATDVNQLLFTSSAGSFPNLDYDDLYVCSTATRLGECKVETLRPSSDDSVQWTPSSGANNFSRVSDTTYDGDTGYVSSSTVGQQDTYGIGALGTTPANIFAAQVNVLARKDDATTRQIATVLKSGATTQVGATQSLGSTYANYVDLYLTDPNTSAAWTPSAINAAKIGQKVIT